MDLFQVMVPQYTQPINIQQNTVIKACCTKPNYLPSSTVYRTVILEADHRLPVVNITVDSLTLFDEVHGIYVTGIDAEQSYPFTGANFWQNDEIPARYDYFDVDLNPIESVDCNIKISWRHWL